MTLKSQMESDFDVILSNTDEFAESATYDPADPAIASFTCTVIISEITIDDLDRNAVRDLCECRISHSTFDDNSMDGPTTRAERRTGDTVTLTGADGDAETWEIIEKRYQAGVWVLVLERNIRIVP